MVPSNLVQFTDAQATNSPLVPREIAPTIPVKRLRKAQLSDILQELNLLSYALVNL
jgi:hypothetical protein